ncbi:predicted protein [Naegleria gruberi]|uniref:Predicted protein n=1 Tax=Naegleria gruberi TaxID=5762 RepID=D2VBH9_NAEGR|nr:uncharacterized protein NAEGRDRAFT_48208 [Naegleria gruberi]EFC45909.1 predicted protein [Naegleria gruberi]|eukprot:XP_002678653.1 predicted protein [Naegleria gruberi strain NEG-M]
MMNQFDSTIFIPTNNMMHNSDGSSTNSVLLGSSNNNSYLDPSLYRSSVVEGSQHIHIGHFASMPILLSLPSSDDTSSSDNLVASVDGMTCFLDQEYQDCKNRLLMQNFVLPRSSIALISHQHARKEVTSFIKVSKSISVLDKPSEELGVSKNEFSYLTDLWGQMFKLPQTMLKYSGKHDSFWRGSIFSNLYRFITRDFEHLFDENRDFQLTNQMEKTKFDGSFFIGLNHQRNKEIRELTRRVSQITSPKPMQQPNPLQIEQHFLNGTFLPFFCSRECNDINGNQFQAENELAIMLKAFLEAQYNFFQQSGAKPRKRFVTGITCVGPLVTCYVMRRFYTLVENYGEEVSKKSESVEPVYIMQSFETFNLSNYDDLLRCAKYMTGVRKFAEVFYNDIRNCLRHICGLPIIKTVTTTNNGNEQKGITPASNGSNISQQDGSSLQTLDTNMTLQTPQKAKVKQQQQVSSASPKSQSKEKVDLKRKQAPESSKVSERSVSIANQSQKKQKVEISPERSTKEVEAAQKDSLNTSGIEDLSQVSMVESGNGDDARVESGNSSDLDE